MLTPDQSRLRVQDAKILRIEADNERLRRKLKGVIESLVPLIKVAVLPELGFTQRTKLRADLDELTNMKEEDF